jgi:SAM-dependent methyltransferase
VSVIGASNMDCPLCGGDDVITHRNVPTAPIAGYWRGIGFDIRAAFPNLPPNLERRLCLNCDLRFFAPQLVGGPDLYKALGRTSIYYGAVKWEFVEVLRMLAQRDRAGAILEYGCGRGWFLERAAAFFERAVGIDFNRDAVEECRVRGLDVNSVELKDLHGNFDVIAAFQVIEHVAAPGETLRHLARLLRPGGQLIVAVPNEDSLLGDLDNNFLNLPPHHASCWTRKTIEHVAGMLSLKLEHYLREPLGMDLYLAALHERFDRHLVARSWLMRPWLWLIRRAAVAYALTQIDKARAHSFGHTHIAVFRNVAGSGRELKASVP